MGDGLPVPEGATEEQVNPQPVAWPKCDRCGVAYVLRRCLSFTTGGYVWAWMRDCEKPRSACKGAGAVVATIDAP